MKIERRELLDCVQVEDLSLVEYILFILFLCLYLYMNPHVFARNFGKGNMRLISAGGGRMYGEEEQGSRLCVSDCVAAHQTCFLSGHTVPVASRTP